MKINTNICITVPKEIEPDVEFLLNEYEAEINPHINIDFLYDIDEEYSPMELREANSLIEDLFEFLSDRNDELGFS